MKELGRALGFALLAVACGGAEPPRMTSACASGDTALGAVDVRPILEKACFGCHGPGGEAKDDLDMSTDASLRRQRARIGYAVERRTMPPPPRHGLQGADRELVLRWAKCGS